MFIPHYVSYVMCHVSRVMCHVSLVTSNLSPVTCHLSPVTCHMSKYFFKTFSERRKKINIYIIFFPLKKLDKVVELVGGGSVINGAYPV